MFDRMAEHSPEFLALGEDIKTNGLREPITTLRGRVPSRFALAFILPSPRGAIHT
jgi:hypothetical protein